MLNLNSIMIGTMQPEVLGPFYEKFLGGNPVKVKQGYVKFLPEWAPVNLALSTGGHSAAGTIDHVGVQVDSVETVMSQLARVKAAGLPVKEEMGVNCCHANQDKFWVQDPDGVEWEVYVLNHDIDEPATAGCATDATASPMKGLQVVSSGGCCAPA